ncbi:hypothetical protein LHYA1_G003572 [Lachnellula hyalina]|uniref:HAUS augmin-like complex subunit 1 n=1 Tax=Lachnellula hyalina TaxID=1316788 RepID=A0A8H8R0X0_9HELO|nr:uncharacterized protein LHYA1_G003572 [Lachnellula hyalina]TVY26458.1 hypothetical protein LHYA1_G003572 [Lachnellula hyalina]
MYTYTSQTTTTTTTMAHLSPSASAIFSPSVARQQLAAAKDWNYIDSWLSTKFNGKTPPVFERNNDTLKALLALAALNETADEERELLARVEAKALQDLQAQEDANPNKYLLDSIEEFLTREGQTSLEALSSLSVSLNQPVFDLQKLGRGIIDLHVTVNDLDQVADRVSIFEKHLKRELEEINILITDLQSDAYQPPSDLAKRTSDYQRRIKGLAAKLPDLKERVASLSANVGTPITIQDVKNEEDKFKALMVTVKDLEAQVKSYHGLPQDTDLARLELEGLRVELREMTRKRDSMFEGLVERESPIKPR